MRPILPLQHYRSANRFSQNGEDGVISELCRRFSFSTGWFCEFGAWDGRYGSNCYSLLLGGWRGVMIEGERDRCVSLRRLATRHPGLIPIEAFVSSDGASPKSLDNILAQTPIPHEFELLSIDIDGYDYQVWSSLQDYRPIIVIIEIDSSVPPGLERIADGRMTTTFSAMLKLGVAKGYRLAAHTGNLIFVREDYAGRSGLSQHELSHPENLFVRDWVRPTPLGRLRRKLKYLTPQRAWVKLENFLARR
jgi:hypothetical protein